MTASHYINETKSDIRGIKHGWYAIEDDGELSSGPFSSLEECVKKSLSRRTRRWRLVCNEGRTKITSLPTSGVEGGVGRCN